MIDIELGFDWTRLGCIMKLVMSGGGQIDLRGLDRAVAMVAIVSLPLNWVCRYNSLDK
jgi:hypothetical protein